MSSSGLLTPVDHLERMHLRCLIWFWLFFVGAVLSGLVVLGLFINPASPGVVDGHAVAFAATIGGVLASATVVVAVCAFVSKALIVARTSERAA